MSCYTPSQWTTWNEKGLLVYIYPHWMENGCLYNVYWHVDRVDPGTGERSPVDSTNQNAFMKKTCDLIFRTASTTRQVNMEYNTQILSTFPYTISNGDDKNRTNKQRIISVLIAFFFYRQIICTQIIYYILSITFLIMSVNIMSVIFCRLPFWLCPLITMIIPGLLIGHAVLMFC